MRFHQLLLNQGSDRFYRQVLPTRVFQRNRVVCDDKINIDERFILPAYLSTIHRSYNPVLDIDDLANPSNDIDIFDRYVRVEKMSVRPISDIVQAIFHRFY